MQNGVVNIIVAGLGGQGVLKASDILADAALFAGYDVKKAEIHGMSQRGGSVSTDVRFGEKVLSPMVPPGQADYLLVLAEDQVENNRSSLAEGGLLLEPIAIAGIDLPHRRSANVALLGRLSRELDLPEEAWHTAIERNLKPELHEINHEAFRLGREQGT